jgi:hypothetical protein
MLKMKRIATSALVLVALVLGITSSIAEAANGVPVVQTIPVTFDLSSDTCSHLPRGTKIHGEGSEVSITTETTDRRGVRTIRNTTTATGTAKDQNENSYAFEYANQFEITNSLRKPDHFSGLMTDIFVLAGAGPVLLDNGFVAELTATADVSYVFSWDVHHKFGNPILFQRGLVVAQCDPL